MVLSSPAGDSVAKPTLAWRDVAAEATWPWRDVAAESC
jgi:hypothetical protein